MGESVPTVAIPNTPETPTSNYMGYPNWWHELQARKKKDNTTTKKGTGRAAVLIVEPQLSLIPMVDSSTTVNNQGNCGQVLCSSSTRNNGAWIIDSGATDYYQKVLFCRPNYNGFKHLCVVIIFI